MSSRRKIEQPRPSVVTAPARSERAEKGISGRIKRIAQDWLGGTRKKVADTLAQDELPSEELQVQHTFEQVRRLLEVGSDQTPDFLLTEMRDAFRRLRDVYAISMRQEPLAAFCHHLLGRLSMVRVFYAPDKKLDDFLLDCIRIAIPVGTYLPPAVLNHEQRAQSFRDWEEMFAGSTNASVREHGFFQQLLHGMLNRFLIHEYASPTEHDRLVHEPRLNSGREQLEQLPFKRYLREFEEQWRPHSRTLADHLPPETEDAAISLLRRAVPPGMDSRHLFSTSLYLKGVWANEHDPQNTSIGSLINAQVISGLDRRYVHVQGALNLTKDAQGRFSPLHNCLKDIAIWRPFYNHQTYDQGCAVPWDSAEDIDVFDEDQYGINEHHVLTFVMNLHAAVRSASSIVGVFEALFPDLHPQVFLSYGSDQPHPDLKRRLTRLYNVADRLFEDRKLVQFFKAFTRCVDAFTVEQWEEPLPNIDHTPWTLVRKMARSCFPRSDAEAQERYESYSEVVRTQVAKWEFLNDSVSSRPAPDSSVPQFQESAEQAETRQRWHQLVRRFRGWRKIQRDLCLQLVDDVFHQIGWNLEEFIDRDPDQRSLTALRARFDDPETAADLKIILGESEGIVFAHIPFLKA